MENEDYQALYPCVYQAAVTYTSVFYLILLVLSLVLFVVVPKAVALAAVGSFAAIILVSLRLIRKHLNEEIYHYFSFFNGIFIFSLIFLLSAIFLESFEYERFFFYTASYVSAFILGVVLNPNWIGNKLDLENKRLYTLIMRPPATIKPVEMLLLIVGMVLSTIIRVFYEGHLLMWLCAWVFSLFSGILLSQILRVLALQKQYGTIFYNELGPDLPENHWTMANRTSLFSGLAFTQNRIRHGRLHTPEGTDEQRDGNQN